MTEPDFSKLVGDLLKWGRETPWLEFKINNAADIGAYVSAIANAAVLEGREEGYLLWGIDDKTRAPVGTDLVPEDLKIGNQALLIHLSTQLEPQVHLQFFSGVFQGKRIVILRMPAANTTPLSYKGERFIRIGESRTLLRAHPDTERLLWNRLDKTPFELRTAKVVSDESEVLSLLDYPKYFSLVGAPLPENRAAILEKLAADRLVKRDAGGWAITNCGALLFARSLSSFDPLARKAVRVVAYVGDNRVDILRQQAGDRGYASGFEGLIAWIHGQLPQNEHIGEALRTTAAMYPPAAIREIVANALIHQDCSISGAGPLIELFANRIEIQNPGKPIIDPSRLDLPPRSRNEALASLMRRMGMCEELGSGIDRMLTAVEAFQLPAPEFSTPGDNMRVTLFAHRSFAQMDKAERVRAAYQHAGLLYITGSRMTNSTFRKRLGVSDENYPQVSAVIREAQNEGMIQPDDPGNKAPRHAKYVPFWAAQRESSGF